MKFTYRITQEDYQKIIEYTLKKRAATPKSRLVLFLSTAGLLILVAGLIICNPFTAKQKIILTLAAALAACVNYFSSRAFRTKANNILTQMMKRGQIHPEFWKEHTLEEKEDGLLLTFGEKEFLYPWQSISDAELDDNFLYLVNIQGTIVEGVPRHAVSREELNLLIGKLKDHK